jgi:hypothetical protein
MPKPVKKVIPPVRIDRPERPIMARGNVVAWRRFALVLGLFLAFLTIVLLIYSPFYFASVSVEAI